MVFRLSESAALLRTTLVALAIPVGLAMGRIIGIGLKLHYDQDIHVWPAVTRCRICEQRVWIWQAYERRNFTVELDNKDHIAASLSMNGIVHASCEGSPRVPVKITVKR